MMLRWCAVLLLSSRLGGGFNCTSRFMESVMSIRGRVSTEVCIGGWEGVSSDRGVFELGERNALSSLHFFERARFTRHG